MGIYKKIINSKLSYTPKGAGQMTTKEFEILMNHLGWGDPDAILWTVGIEEAETWCTDEKSQDLSRVKERIRREFAKKVEPVSEEDPNFPIAYPIAKIACGVSASYHNWKKEWKDYRRDKLWKEGSKICNINIYPLGKDSLNSSFPKCYRELFGIDNWEDYKKIVKEQRFQVIQNFYKEKQPQAVICYGKSHWSEFEEVFKLHKEKSEDHGDKLTKIYPEKRIILTRHFSVGFRDNTCEFIVEKLKEWNVEIP